MTKGASAFDMRLAALREDGPHHRHHQRRIANLGRRRAKGESDDRRSHLGRGTKRAWRQRQEASDVGAERRAQRQHAVFAGSGAGDKPIGDLLLQHQRRVAEDPPLAPRRSAETGSATRCCTAGCRRRAGGCRGRLASLANGRARSTRSDGEDVSGHYRDVRERARVERRRQIAIDLDRQQPIDLRRERHRDRAAARTDLDHPSVLQRLDRRHQLGDPGGLEKMLREALAGPHHGLCLIVDRLSAPVALLDLHDLFFAQAEVVAQLVNQRLADRDDDLVLVAVGVFLDRAIETA